MRSKHCFFEKEEYLNGYIRGAIAALKNENAEVVCASCLTGTIRNLSQDVAVKLEKIIKELLHGFVKKEHDRIETYSNLPYVKIQRERSET
ncbi:MAG: hypothetical protein R3E63_02145 [Pseudomonadales bacterium]